ncbi:MAG: hypothetical protein ABUK08_02690 [Candidatus Humimicrobiaceae bacterium]|jgi:hypoxanthine phosphoribosyltransferase
MARNVLRVRRNSTKNNKLELEFKNAENIVFAHESEKEFAKILDFYRIKWEYEPKTFTLEWDENDIPVLSFTPDFYLSELDLFIELTTLNQKLVTKKNRKIKKVRELYPEINVKLFYKKDYNSLLFKYLNR